MFCFGIAGFLLDHWTIGQRSVANMQKAEKTRSDCGVCGYFVEFVRLQAQEGN